MNLTRLDEPADQVVNVVGPICESADVLGHDRLLPSSTQKGDVLLIANAGAYGHAMSSRYNLREPRRRAVSVRQLARAVIGTVGKVSCAVHGRTPL